MATTIKIVLFEDTEQIRSEILQALKKYLGSDGVVLPFEHSRFKESTSEMEKMYEERLERILSNQPFDGATLVVADRDLSKSKDSNFGGLSVNAVAAASKRLAIP